MKTLKLAFTFMLALFALGTWAQGPNNSGTYYKNADGKKGEALKTALYNIIKTSKESVAGYSGLKAAYKKTDTRADGKLRDWYSNITNYVPGSAFASSYKKEGDGYNREHLVPQSWFNKVEPMRSDIVHVVPTDAKINGLRSDLYLGEVGSIDEQSANGYSKKGSCKTSGYSGTVFEPNDAIKGDIARIYFYMATCYENVITGWGGGLMSGTKYQPFAQWSFDMFLRWSKEDPIDDVEIARNKAVYTVQSNRNPFVDYPGLEDYIWGDMKNVAFNYANYTTTGIETFDETPILPTDNRTYDLRGRQVDDSHLMPGVYIRNGKKFFVK